MYAQVEKVSTCSRAALKKKVGFWQDWSGDGTVRIGWTGENVQGWTVGYAADKIEIEGIKYDMPRGTKEQRIICRMPEDHAIWPGKLAVATPDGKSVQFVDSSEQAFASWPGILEHRAITVLQ